MTLGRGLYALGVIGIFGVIFTAIGESSAGAADVVPTPLPVRVERSTCPNASAEDVTALLRVELGAQLEDRASGRAHSIAIDCEGDWASIAIETPGQSPRSFERNLRGAPANVRARIVALAIAEYVRDLDREPRPVVKPEPPPVIITAPPTQERVAPSSTERRQRRVRLSAFGQLSNFQFNEVWLAGGGLRFEYGYRWFAAGWDATLLTADERVDLGSARVLLGYGSPHVAWRARWGAMESRLGAGYAIGMAKISGRADERGAIASSISGVWAAPYAFVSLAWNISRLLGVEMRAQGGWVMMPVIGDVSRGEGMSLQQAWTSLQLGASLSL